MHDLYVVYDGNETIDCAFHTIVIRNEALAEKYPGGIKAFVEKHSPRCNNDITVSCHMGEDAVDVLEDLIKYGLSKATDFFFLMPHRTSSDSECPKTKKVPTILVSNRNG